jgi:hypothetical protein
MKMAFRDGNRQGECLEIGAGPRELDSALQINTELMMIVNPPYAQSPKAPHPNNNTWTALLSMFRHRKSTRLTVEHESTFGTSTQEQLR